MRRTLVAVLAVVLLVAGAAAVAHKTQQSGLEVAAEAQPQPDLELIGNKSGCYGASCHGKNPANLCDGDGITVASRAVKDGMLELRYSPSCKSNWGRYTPYRQNAYGYTAQKIVLHARVTAWSPGGPSVNSAHNDTSWNNFGTSWSQMVDGTKEACTGVELSYIGDTAKSGTSEAPVGWVDKVWQWGPCY